MIQSTTISLRSLVADLEVGEVLTIPSSLYGYTTIRSYAYELGLILNRKFKSSLDRSTQTYSITRLS